MTAIGMDIGHSAVKLSFQSPNNPEGEITHISFPATAIPSFMIQDDAERKLSLLDHVLVPNTNQHSEGSFFTGDTAITHGSQSVTGLHFDWIKTAEHSALIMAAKKKLDQYGVRQENRTVVLGLPVSSFGSQKEILRQIAQVLMPASTIKVVIQPIAALHTELLDASGRNIPGRSFIEESWAVVDIGHFTTDVVAIENGRYQPRKSDSCRGVFKACEALTQILSLSGIPDVTMVEAEKCLHTNTIKNWGVVTDIKNQCAEAKQTIINEISDMSTRLLSDGARQRTGTLLTGGGAPILYDHIKAIWPNTKTSPLGRYAVSEGMRRMACHVINGTT